MNFDISVVILRFGVLILLYLFLLQVIAVVRSEIGRPAGTPRRSGASPLARLIVSDGGRSDLITGDIITLSPVTSIGRSPGSGIRITDDFVSSEHALINFRDRQWWIEDLASTNGTLVNRRPVEKPTILADGDMIEVGSVHFRFERGGWTA